MKTFTMSRVIRQSVGFCEDDFDTLEEFNDFVMEMESNEDNMFNTFEDNLDTDSYEVIEGIRTKVTED